MVTIKTESAALNNHHHEWEQQHLAPVLIHSVILHNITRIGLTL